MSTAVGWPFGQAGGGWRPGMMLVVFAAPSVRCMGAHAVLNIGCYERDCCGASLHERLAAIGGDFARAAVGGDAVERSGE